MVGPNDLIGTLEIPVKQLLKSKSGVLGPYWGNIYGPPIVLDGEIGNAQFYQMECRYGKLGSHYRGRLLYQVRHWPEQVAKTSVEDCRFRFPDNPQPVAPQKGYLLRVDVLEGSEFPDTDLD